MDDRIDTRSATLKVLVAGAVLAGTLTSGAAVAAGDGQPVDEAGSLVTGPTVTGFIDPVVRATWLEAHHAIEHRAELARGTALDPLVRATWLEEHRAIEYRAELARGTALDPLVLATWLEEHRAIEQRG